MGGESFIDAMLLTGDLSDGTPQNYASGIIKSTYKGHKTEGHAGADAGYRSYFLRFPDEHFSVIILANFANANTTALSLQVADIFLKDKGIQQPTFKADGSITKGWAGEYFDETTQSIVKIEFKNEKLQVGAIELIPTSNSIFYTGTSVFTFSSDSLKTSLTLNTSGSKIKKYAKVQRITLSADELKDYQGSFYSPELDTKYVLTIKDSSLQIKIPRRDDKRISPFMKDLFADGLVIRFSRNKKNIIDGFFLSTVRVRNLRFEKMPVIK